MLDLTLAKAVRAVPAFRPVHLLPRWLLLLWRAAVRHAERPGPFVPYC